MVLALSCVTVDAASRRADTPTAPATAGAVPEGKGPHAVFVVGEDHFYGALKTMPELAAELEAKHDMRCTVLRAVSHTDIPGLEALRHADLAVFYIRRRLLPPEQMGCIRAYLEAGKPLIAFRTTTHAFQPYDDNPPAGKQRWDRFDREVLGCRYGGYDSGETRVEVAPDAAAHPILDGFDGPYQERETLYRCLPLADSCRVLLSGTCVDGTGSDDRYRKRPGPDRPLQPVAWVNTSKQGGKVFFTSMGHHTTFQKPWFRRLIVNAVFWALGRPVPEAAASEDRSIETN